MAAKEEKLINDLNRLANSIQSGKSQISTIEHRMHRDRLKGREILFELMLIMTHRQYLRLVESR